MTDRVPQYPGRVKLTPVSGQDGVFDMVRADEPTQEGTPMNKGTLLADETAEILGLDPADDPTVNDGFLAAFLAARGGCLLKITPTVNGEVAKAGIPISGASSLTSDELVTTGSATLYAITTTETTTLTVDSVLDLSGTSQTVSTPQGRVVNVLLSLMRTESGTITFASSTVAKFSPYVSTIDICCVGGGGGGAVGTGNGGGGGGGGYVTNRLKESITPGSDLTVTVGAGGSAGNQSTGAGGTNGGTTVVFYKSSTGANMAVQANGGSPGNVHDGGPGNGAGGTGFYYNGNPGNPGTVRQFDEATGQLYSGGGGGGNNGSGGSSYGGVGGDINANGHSANGPGGGGGGAGRSTSAALYAGSGYRGEVAIRWGYAE